MKYKFSKLVEEEVEYETPCFVKFTDNIFYKIVDEQFLVMVKLFSFCTCIEIVSRDQNNPFASDGWKFTTEEEYLTAVHIAQKRISEYTNVPEVA